MLVSSWVPGALGLFLRSKLYPLVLGRSDATSCLASTSRSAIRTRSRSATTSSSTTAAASTRRAPTTRASPSATGVFVGRNTILSCKNGDIVIDDHANLGFNCEIFSASRVRVGKSILMAAYTYLVGGDHLYDRVDIPVLRAGPDRARDRRRRQRLARHARGRDRRLAHRPRCDHRRGRRRRGRDPGVRDRDRDSGEGDAGPSCEGPSVTRPVPRPPTVSRPLD